MSAKHTPGPWRVEEGTALVWGACDPDDLSSWGMGKPVAEARDRQVFGSVFTNRFYDDAEVEANTRLIASAPELLAVLSDLLASYDEEACAILVEPDPGCPLCTANTTPYDRTTGPCAYHRARAAIAAAKGETQ